MSKMSRESREEALERILAETAKNPYTPRKPVRPAPSSAQRNNPVNAQTPKPEPAPDGITISRIPTEAQKAEAAKARAAKRVEEIKRARQQREAQEKQFEESIINYASSESRRYSENRPPVQSRQEAENQAVAEDRKIQENRRSYESRIPFHEEKPVESKEAALTENASVAVPMPENNIRRRPDEKKKRKESTGLWDDDALIRYDSDIFGIDHITDIAEWVIAVFLVILMLYTYVIGMIDVNGTSMSPTLAENDKLVMRKIDVSPENGDVVVIDNKGSHLINADGKVVEGKGLDKSIVKRVIAKGGQTIDIDFESGTVMVDGKTLNEKYISEPTVRNELAFTYPLTVPEGYLFVMGDNRNLSMDSRHPDIGLVPEEDVLGEIILRVYPFDKFGGVD